MKRILFMLLILSAACGKDDGDRKPDYTPDNYDCATCEGMEGVRWYITINRDLIQDCHAFEDFQLNDDGTVTVWRIGHGKDGESITKEIKAVCKYTRVGCEIELFDLIPGYLDDFSNCDGFSLASEVRSSVDDENHTTEILGNTCVAMVIGFAIYTSEEP